MIQSFPPEILEAISKVIGNTEKGFTGSELERLLVQSQIADPGPLTKWRRLLEAFTNQQSKDRCGNKIGTFLQAAMAPARYLQDKELFEKRRFQLNQILSLCGLSLSEEGKLIAVTQARTVREDLQRATNLKIKLHDRGTHPEVFKYCLPELIEENYFHAVFEATKGVFARLREKTGLTCDGSEIVDRAFSMQDQLVAINTLRTESEKSEHKGFANLLKGVFVLFEALWHMRLSLIGKWMNKMLWMALH